MTDTKEREIAENNMSSRSASFMHVMLGYPSQIPSSHQCIAGIRWVQSSCFRLVHYPSSSILVSNTSLLLQLVALLLWHRHRQFRVRAGRQRCGVLSCSLVYHRGLLQSPAPVFN